MKIDITETADKSIKIRFYDKKIMYELEFFDDGGMVFCEIDIKKETIEDIEDTKDLFRRLNTIVTYNKSLNLT